jgi:hypothetical protein
VFVNGEVPVIGEADVVYTGENLTPTSPKGAIMMLPEGTDIFSVNPQELIRTLSLTTVRLNLFDPAMIDGSLGDFEGYGSSVVPGRAYLVLMSDGRHFGLMQIPDEFGDPGEEENPFLIFDYRYEDSFLLPSGF